MVDAINLNNIQKYLNKKQINFIIGGWICTKVMSRGRSLNKK
jgi:hypothetical protein